MEALESLRKNGQKFIEDVDGLANTKFKDAKNLKEIADELCKMDLFDEIGEIGKDIENKAKNLIGAIGNMF